MILIPLSSIEKCIIICMFSATLLSYDLLYTH
jgi:hypothetical protein